MNRLFYGLVASSVLLSNPAFAADPMLVDGAGNRQPTGEHMPAASAKKIPITVGFVNLSGDDFSAMLNDDVAVLSPLFENVVVTTPTEIPRTAILFVYAHFNEDGSVRGLWFWGGIRQIVEGTQARIVIVASPNPGATVKKAVGISGPKTANIVFTLDRNQQHFGAFFKALFERMRDGEDMLQAWVRIAPQGPVQPPDIPSTILLAEAGERLVFPK
jgi:hypothetical protein